MDINDQRDYAEEAANRREMESELDDTPALFLKVGDRVRNVGTYSTAVPAGHLGIVYAGPNSSYGVTVLWDGWETWRPYWPTSELQKVTDE